MDRPATSRAIFLVHGHDEAPKHQVARFIAQATGIQPIILDEQASSGKTLIEKFEHHAAERGLRSGAANRR